VIKEELLNKLDRARIPQHVAIIMDGNGRWAKRRGLPRIAGHKAGIESVRIVVRMARELEIKVLTLYAFSTENWQRPREEIDALMKLLELYLKKEKQALIERNIKFMVIGRVEGLPSRVQQLIEEVKRSTGGNDGLILNLALNYSGRLEIVDGVKKLLDSGIRREDLTEELFRCYLYAPDLPDPDLLIRTSGELRISNFLLWQLAYTELWITEVLWPDFREVHFLEALLEYQRRERRFGRVE
jgi:undecaprenyl diphosphate synthase